MTEGLLYRRKRDPLVARLRRNNLAVKALRLVLSARFLPLHGAHDRYIIVVRLRSGAKT